MRRTTMGKIVSQYVQKKPGWVVSDVPVSLWGETVIQPLLTHLMIPACHFEAASTGKTHGALPKNDTLTLTGWIKLPLAQPSGPDSPRSSRRWLRNKLYIPLYWEDDPETHGQRVVTSLDMIQTYQHQGVYPSMAFAYLPHPEALGQLLLALYEQSQQEAFKEQKTGKVKHLQARAVEAQIRQLANEQQFAFIVHTSERLIRITLRLEGHNRLTVSIPFSEFQNVLPSLREAVAHLLALNRRRIHFKMHQQYHDRDAWIEPEPPRADTPIHSSEESI